MYVGKDFSPISPDETIDLSFDFVHDVETGETINSSTWSLEVAETETGATADSAPSSRISGSASVEESAIGGADTVAVQRFTGMVDGNRYLVVCRAVTSLGQTLELHARVWCREAA